MPSCRRSRSREARCNRDNNQHDTKALKGEPPKDRAREVTTNNTTDSTGTSHQGVTKESEGRRRDGDRDYDASRANSNKEGEGVTGDGGKRQEGEGGKDIQAREELEGGGGGDGEKKGSLP